MLSSDLIWHTIPLSIRELNLSKVLICGQAFRWRVNPSHQITNSPLIWSSTLKSHIIFLKQTSEELSFSSYPMHPNIHSIIHDYFQLDVNLIKLYSDWVKIDSNFQSKAFQFEGVRMLRQDPFETLLSFICSSNNNIKRISMMCQNLCLKYGDFIGEIDGVSYHSFPTVDKLIGLDLETQLRELGFGYRAKYIASTCLQIHTNKDNVDSLRDVTYQEAHESLLSYKGVGPKIADCICLMALDKTETIPVDTHVFQIAKRDYKLKLKGESVNKGNYQIISEFFKSKWGKYAGWAQTVMFAADLKELNKPTNKILQGEQVVSISDGFPGVKRELELGIKQEISEETLILKSIVKIEVNDEQEMEYYNNGRPKRKRRSHFQTSIDN